MAAPGKRAIPHADQHPHIAKLRIGSVLGSAIRLYQLEPARVAVASIAVLLPFTLVSEGVHEIEAHLPPSTTHDPRFLLTVLPSSAEFLALLGMVILGGVMDELVGATVRGEPLPSLAEAAGSLPFGVLVVADLVVVAMVSVAGLLGGIPGLLLAALLGIVGPVVNIEHQGPVRAAERSLSLTWPHAWLSICIVAPATIGPLVSIGNQRSRARKAAPNPVTSSPAEDDGQHDGCDNARSAMKPEYPEQRRSPPFVSVGGWIGHVNHEWLNDRADNEEDAE